MIDWIKIAQEVAAIVAARDTAGRSIVQLAVDDWVLDKLSWRSMPTRASWRTGPTPSPTTMPRRTGCPSCCSIWRGRGSSGAGGPEPWHSVPSIDPWHVR
jgi:hypothetical protein